MRPAKRQNNMKNDLLTPWRYWCRLCAKDDPVSNVNIYCKNEEGAADASLSTAIGKYFWVNINRHDDLPTYLCVDCHTLITSLVTFTERVNKVQAMFCLLQNASSCNPVNPDEVRVQYGLLDEERVHVIKHQHNENIEEDMQMKMLQDLEDLNGELVEFEQMEEAEYALDEEEEEVDNDAEIEEEVHQEIINFEITEQDDTELKRIEQDLQSEQHEKFEADELRKLEESAEIEAVTEDEVEDSDLYRELKLKDEEEEAGVYKHIADDEEDENERHHQESSYNGESDDEGEVPADVQENHDTDTAASINVKRKRGRPPKDITAKRKKTELDSDGDTSSGSYKYDCKICLRKYKNPTSYRKHMVEAHKLSSDLPDFKCDKCAKIFPTERQLEVHMRTHLALEDKLEIPCPYCGRRFTKMGVMRQHVDGFHHNLKPYICDECGRALKTLAALNEHKLVHTNDCPFECEICQKGFKNKARLKVHYDTHTATTYVCSECGLQLNTRRTLKMHMLVHSDMKQYKCDFCGSEFKRSKALKNHLILHTGLKPYICNFCEKSFSNGSNCRSHKKKAHPKELAEEEAQGKKSAPISVPKLQELRSSAVVVENPRKVQRHAGGLPPRMRALLIAAEERAKKLEASKKTMTSATAVNSIQMPCQIESTESDDNAAVGEAYEDEDEETVIYEIIDEI